MRESPQLTGCPVGENMPCQSTLSSVVFIAYVPVQHARHGSVAARALHLDQFRLLHPGSGDPLPCRRADALVKRR